MFFFTEVGTVFVLNNLFKDACKALGGRDNVTPENKAALFSIQYKKDHISFQGKGCAGLLEAPYLRLRFPKFQFLSWDINPLHVQHPSRSA